MKPAGNQHSGRKRAILDGMLAVHSMLIDAQYMRQGLVAATTRGGPDYGPAYIATALRFYDETVGNATRRLAAVRRMIDAAPASTRRRWRAGR